MTSDSTATSTVPVCARCGAGHFMTVEGLCSNCLLRLALLPEAQSDDGAAPELAPGKTVTGMSA